MRGVRAPGARVPVAGRHARRAGYGARVPVAGRHARRAAAGRRSPVVMRDARGLGASGCAWRGRAAGGPRGPWPARRRHSPPCGASPHSPVRSVTCFTPVRWTGCPRQPGAGRRNHAWLRRSVWRVGRCAVGPRSGVRDRTAGDSSPVTRRAAGSGDARNRPHRGLPSQRRRLPPPTGAPRPARRAPDAGARARGPAPASHRGDRGAPDATRNSLFRRRLQAISARPRTRLGLLLPAVHAPPARAGTRRHGTTGRRYPAVPRWRFPAPASAKDLGS